MTYDTINDLQTIAGNAEGTLLADRYRIVRQLGQGGMGSVWLAEDTQLDDKQFAIKMLPSILVSNKRAYRQLKDEALVAMRLVHPNIVQIRAFEENNGNPFLVMDYIDGQTLDEYLGELRIENGELRIGGAPSGTGGSPVLYGLPEAEVIRILKPIAAALDYAHGEGVVHRDVKPANVMIRKDGHPFILDFGIAREIQETMTRVTGKLSSGTLLYMSPEQLHGAQPKKEQDIYSFAAMAYECLKGEPPFKRGQIEYQIDNDVPEPMPGGPCSVAAAIMAGLAKKPEDRPATCAAVLEGGLSTQRREDAEAQNGRAGAGRPPQDDGGARRPAEPVGSRVPRVRVDATEDEAKQVRAEAKIRMLRLKQISDDDGFARRKSELNDAFQKADIFFESGLWADAASRFAECSWQAENLEKLDPERKTAVEVRKKAVAAQSGAKNAQAGRYAAAEWGNAARLLSYGDAAYGRMDFAAAIVAFGDSAAGFAKSEHKAIAKRKTLYEAERKALYEAVRGLGKKILIGLCALLGLVGAGLLLSAIGNMIGNDVKEISPTRSKKGVHVKKILPTQSEKGVHVKEILPTQSEKGVRRKVQLWEGGPYWACKNIGAEEPWESGYHFWLGDTVGYKCVGDTWVASDGSGQHFSFCEANASTYGKSYVALEREGWITEAGVLAPEHDAAQRHWGGSWRMPTKQELGYLNSKCVWKWAKMNGVYGYEVRGKGSYASASIFLPCSGYGYGTSLYYAGSDGYYWSSVPYSDSSSYSRSAWGLGFNSSGHSTYSYYRYFGQSVRPVQGFTR